MTRAVLCDSNAILALLDADDADQTCAVAARRIATERRPCFLANDRGVGLAPNASTALKAIQT